MAIAFNLPSDEATEENYARLNRLLAELYEVLCHILVSRQPMASSSSADSGIDPDFGQPQPHPRVRPASDSDTVSDHESRRSTLGPLPDLLGNVPTTPPRPRPRSATNPGYGVLEPMFDYNDDDDDVFLTARPDESVFVTHAPRSDCLYPRPRTRPDEFLTPRPRVRRRPGLIGKTWLEKNRLTGDETDGRLSHPINTDDSKSHDTTDSPSSSSGIKMEEESEGSLLSLLLPDRFSGSLWTAVLVVVGWKLLANKR